MRLQIPPTGRSSGSAAIRLLSSAARAAPGRRRPQRSPCATSPASRVPTRHTGPASRRRSSTLARSSSPSAMRAPSGTSIRLASGSTMRWPSTGSARWSARASRPSCWRAREWSRSRRARGTTTCSTRCWRASTTRPSTASSSPAPPGTVSCAWGAAGHTARAARRGGSWSCARRWRPSWTRGWSARSWRSSPRSYTSARWSAWTRPGRRAPTSRARTPRGRPARRPGCASTPAGRRPSPGRLASSACRWPGWSAC
mmetsp:Transcript_110860/g.292787  ORF Transcript_110860/g.292787 Transcript_110860/m.292787 type:complete len:256 (+) Transcript_110860:397-1164(+)